MKVTFEVLEILGDMDAISSDLKGKVTGSPILENARGLVPTDSE